MIFKKEMRYLKIFLFICISGLMYSSCEKQANYPDYPVITFNSYVNFCSGTTTDSAYLRINFTDGNGDIGYPANDTSASPDYFIEFYFLNTKRGQYDSVPITSPSSGTVSNIWYYNIPDITPSGKDKELNGIIQINLENAIQFYSGWSGTIDTINFNKFQFKVWIFDRSGNKSNVLITPPESSCAAQD